MDRMNGFEKLESKVNLDNEIIDIATIINSVDTNLLIDAFNYGKFNQVALIQVSHKTKIDAITIKALLPIVLAQRYVKGLEKTDIQIDIHMIHKLIIFSDYTDTITEYQIKDGNVIADRTMIKLKDFLNKYDEQYGEKPGTLLNYLIRYGQFGYDNNKIVFMIR